MVTQFYSIGLIVLLGAMSPGPDFAIVTKNCILYSRKSGFFTSFGVGAAILVHMSYCLLGLALIVANTPILFNLIKYIGALYLIYLGACALFSKHASNVLEPSDITNKATLSSYLSFKQGFLCNLLNPKATIFFLSLFTIFIRPDTPASWEFIYAMEVPLIAIAWFCFLTVILSHPPIKHALERLEKYILKFLGILLMGFGVALVFV